MDHRIIDTASGQIHLLHVTPKDNYHPKGEGTCPKVYSHEVRVRPKQESDF